MALYAKTLSLVEGDELPTLSLRFLHDPDQCGTACEPVDLSVFTEVTVTVKSRAGYLLQDTPLIVRNDQTVNSPDRGLADYLWADGQIASAGRYWVQAKCRLAGNDQTFPDGGDQSDLQSFLVIDVGERL